MRVCEGRWDPEFSGVSGVRRSCTFPAITRASTRSDAEVTPTGGLNIERETERDVTARMDAHGPHACRDYQITMTDVLNIFHELDVTSRGTVAAVDFEAAMVGLGYTAEQAAKIFGVLDVDGDGVLSLADWTNEAVITLARLLSYKMIRATLVGKSLLSARRPPTSVRSRVAPALSQRSCALLLHCTTFTMKGYDHETPMHTSSHVIRLHHTASRPCALALLLHCHCSDRI